MDHASVIVFALFMASIALFATLIAYLLYDDAQRARIMPIGERAAAPHLAPARAQISRVRLGLVAGTFFVWSLILDEPRLEPSV